jgi:hypothetical protein
LVAQPVYLMMHLSYIKSCLQPYRMLLFVCVCGVFLTGADSGSSRDRFIQLDSEVQAIKEEILDINRDILLLEEMALYPHGRQLIVLVSMAPDSRLKPAMISLQLGGETVSEHRYTASEYAAMREGGVHRLYTGWVSGGSHRLLVSVQGEQSKGDAVSQQRSVTITQQTGRKYLELHLGPRGKKTFPDLTIHEW